MCTLQTVFVDLAKFPGPRFVFESVDAHINLRSIDSRKQAWHIKIFLPSSLQPYRVTAPYRAKIHKPDTKSLHGDEDEHLNDLH